MRYLRATLLLLIAMAISSCATFRPYPAEGPLPNDPRLISGRLDNGLSYYVLKTDASHNRINMRLVLNAGSGQDAEGKPGAAHFVEHMALNGSTNFPGDGIERFMEEAGMGKCDCYSATTGADETIYSFTLPSDRLEGGLTILSDISNEVSFDPEELERERGVIVEEWRRGVGRAREHSTKVQLALLEGTPYANGIIGNERAHQESLTREDLLEFYRKWYRPDLMAVIVVGDMGDTKKTVDMIERQFSHLAPAPADAQPRQEIHFPERNEAAYVYVEDELYKSATLSLLINDKVTRSSTMSSVRLSIADVSALSLMNKRLANHTKKIDPPFDFASVSASFPYRWLSEVIISISADKEDMKAAFDIVMDEIGRALRDGFTEKELEKYRKDWIEDIDDSEEDYDPDDESISSIATAISNLFLKDKPTTSHKVRTAVLRDNVKSITLAEVNSEFRQILETYIARMVVVFAPEGSADMMPSREQIIARADAMGESTLAQYSPEKEFEGALIADPTPGRVVKEKRDKKHDYVEWKLSNGATVVAKTVDNEDMKDSIGFTAISHGGTSLADDSLYHSATSALGVVLAGGVGEFDRFTLSKALKDRKLSIMPYIDNDGEGFAGLAEPEELETMLTLMYMYATEPRRDQAAFDEAIDEAVKQFEVNERNPYKVVNEVVAEIFFANHPRKRPVTMDDIKGINLDKAVEFYKGRFENAADFTFFFVGDFSTSKLKPLVERYIGGLPSTGKHEVYKGPFFEFPKGITERTLLIGTQQRGTVMLTFGGDMEWSRDAEYDISAMSSVLQDRLKEIIREESGGTYDIQVRTNTSRKPRQGFGITIIFDCNPDRVDELTAKVMQEIEHVKRSEGIEKNVEALSTKIRQGKEDRQKERELKGKKKEDELDWITILLKHYEYGDDIDTLIDDEWPVERITPEQVGRTAQRYFDMNQYVKLVMIHGL